MKKRILATIGTLILLALASIGWLVLFVQNPVILARARWRYQQVVWQKTDLSKGPCLGPIADGWVLDIAHLPREQIDDLPQNQCHDFQHFVEMSPKGEVIVVK